MGNTLAPSSAIAAQAEPAGAVSSDLIRRERPFKVLRKARKSTCSTITRARTWVMVSYKDMPDLTIDKLNSLGDALKLPQGWKFRTAVLS